MAARMGGAGADALEDLGVSVNDIIQLKPDEQMEVLAKALANVENQALKASIANDIFGRNGTRMLKMLDQLKSEGLDPTVKSLDEMGVSLTRIETAKVESFNDAMFKSSQGTEGLANKLTVRLAPMLEAVSNLFIDGAKGSKGYGDAIDSAFDGAITVIGVFADGLHGINIIFEGLKVGAFAIAKVVNEAFRIMAKGTEGFVNVAIDGVNGIISALNSIPLLDLSIEPIERFTSDAAVMMKRFSDQASENLSGAIDSLHEKMMEPLPSDSIKKWVAEVEEAATAAAEKAVNAITGGGEGEGISQIDTKEIEAAQKELESLLALNETKLEIINSFELEKLELLQGYRDQELISKEEHEAAITEVEANASTARLSLAEAERKAKMAALGGMFGDLSSLMNTKSKKLFKIGKAAAIANATLDGLESAVSAWKSGMAYGGPWAAAAFAGASVLKTGTMIQQISSQSFGGAPSPVSFSGGIPSVNTNGGGGGQSQQGPTNVSIDIVGSEDSTFSRRQIESLIGSINDATGDGVVLNTGG